MKLELLNRLHAIMSKGLLSECQTHIPTGNCHCCEFHPELGNWIGVLENEQEVLNKGDTSNWKIFTEDGSKNIGIICTRDPSGCNNKPLDCMLYPFFPLSYNGEEMEILAGFPKCPMKATFIDSMSDFSFGNLPPISMSEHLKKVVACGYLLHLDGHAEWMANVGANYKGYQVKFIIKVTPNEVEQYLKAACV